MRSAVQAFIGMATSALDLAFPRGCASCDRPIAEADVSMCDACAKLLAAIVSRDYCGCCGREPGPFMVRNGRCSDCLTGRPPFERFARIGRYQSVLRSLVLKLKYAPSPALDVLLGDLVFDMMSAIPGYDHVDVWVPVPSARLRTWRRTYQPTLVLSQRIAARSGSPVVPALTLARRIREQKTLPQDQRAANVRGAFRTAPDIPLRGSTIGLVDDVFTTGSTLREAARTLRAAGAARVLGVVLATATVGRDS